MTASLVMPTVTLTFPNQIVERLADNVRAKLGSTYTVSEVRCYFCHGRLADVIEQGLTTAITERDGRSDREWEGL